MSHTYFTGIHRWTLALAFIFLSACQVNSQVSWAKEADPSKISLPREKVITYSFADGVTIAVHYSEALLRRSGKDARFAKEVLDAAVYSYQTLTDFMGFNEKGYSFAYPDKRYAYDPDRTLDIYLGNSKAFRDAPCFDTRQVSERGFEAMILLPSDYATFIRNWEKVSPSELGPRRVEVDLKGTLAHEMMHAILFYCHKNLEAAASPGLGRTDWYVEGLARYAETFVGAKHDFYSQGFRQTLPGKIRFSRGGANFFMRYPDQGFLRLRYENALFWKYFEGRYGMRGITQFSRYLRGAQISEVPAAFRRATSSNFDDFLEQYAFALLSKDLGLREESAHLSDVAQTRIHYKKGRLYLVDGTGARVLLGKTCRTDWVGQWSEFSSRHGEGSAAGDNTPESDVSGWSTDYYNISWESSEASVLPDIRVANEGGRGDLSIRLAALTRGGTWLKSSPVRIPISQSAKLSVQDLLRENGLRQKD
ncbi:MAG TPA: hypothetical protein VD883_04295, partial [Candidatus Omnitrophota bacterium]|nr:hypothetical protein [Candidatus Omnitrophota bacterium]